MRAPRRHALVALVALVLGAAGCGALDQGGPAPEQREGRVPLRVVEGARGATLVLVPVTIDGEGPFDFALDTGASQTVVDADLVDRLRLETGGRTRAIVGVAGATTGRRVALRRWRVGDVALREQQVVGLDLPEVEGPLGFDGLLGADLLGNFARVTIDFEEEVLVLEPGG